MALKITQSASFWYPVDLHILTDSGDQITHRFKGEFKRLPTEDVEEFQTAGFDPVQYADCVEQAKGDRELAMIILAARLSTSGVSKKSSEDRADELMKVLCGWKDVSDENGDMPFDRSNLIRVLRFSKSAYADIKEAYNKAVNGEGKRGN